MRLGFELTLQQTQKLIMTQELRQAIQILQYTSQELQDYINQQMEINPLIELDIRKKEDSLKENDYSKDKIDWKEYFRQNGYTNYTNYTKDDDNDYTFEEFVSEKKPLKDHLLLQLHLTVNDSRIRRIGEFIIGSIDKNGYLTNTVDEISNYLNINVDDVEEALKLIQTFDPIGVGSRNIKECLKIQLKSRGVTDNNIYVVIDNYLDELASNKLNKISKDLNITLKTVQWISDIIKSLEPKPGRGFPDLGDEIKYITPDVTLREVDGEFVIEVNDITAPRINISNYYKSLLTDTRDENIQNFLNDKLNSAMWIVKSLEQRRVTIYKVVESLLKFQKEFFIKGKKALKPLTLKDVALDIDVHESTVSRTVNGKFIQTPKGIFELRFFFSSGVSGEAGGIASTSVKSIIKDLIEKENSKKPLSDQAIADILNNKNINISRRTVAKYRDELEIPSSTGRKRF